MPCSMRKTLKRVLFSGSKYVNPLSIDPNERVTPSHPGAMGLPGGDNNGFIDPQTANMDDIPDLSIAVGEIGVIPPPPMFSSPSPPPPPPPPLTSNQVTNGHVIVNHQVFHTNITVDGHDLNDLRGQDQPQQPERFVMQEQNSDSEEEEAEDEIEDEDELEDEFDDYGNAYPPVQGLNTRVITTVPAKEPVYNAVPLKSALKKSKGDRNNFVGSASHQQQQPQQPQPSSKSNETSSR